MSARFRRGVKFPHKQAHLDGRRASFSELSEDGSTSGSSKKLAQTLDGIDEKPPTAEEKKAEYEKKKSNFITRTLWTLIMIAGFFLALFSGHIYIIMIMTAIQAISFKEIIAIANLPGRVRGVRPTNLLSWYWLATTMYFLYGESVIYYFKHIILIDKVLLPLTIHHRFISFLLYVFGFVFFVSTLKAGHLRFQFSQFAWTHMALFLILGQAHFIMNNVFDGLIWFFLPAALVITNDIWAYICGITFGRTQLIKLSPKKTVEGFVGAWVMTVLFGILLTNLLLRSNYFICPATNLGSNIFKGLECEPNPVFIPHTYTTPELLFLPAGYKFSVTMAPMQIHTFFWATFASLIAPFGGFFASGLKRSFKIKDFGDSIPGHGGMTDRMDCQFIMGFFAYVYYHTFIAFSTTSVGDVMELAITGLSPAEQIELFKGMSRYLTNQGMMTEEAMACVEHVMMVKR